MLDDALLADPVALATADTGGVLRSAATAGAQVRSAAQAGAEAGVGELSGSTPRSLVLLRRPGTSAWAAPLVAALLGPECPIPVIIADVAPSWVGPLDVLVAHTADPSDTVLAESIGMAVHRGCEVVLSAPAQGPVTAAGAGRARLLDPRVPVPPGLDLPRALTTGLVTVAALGVLPTRMTAADLDRLADELDREAERDHPRHEPFVNPAKALAMRLADQTPLLWGTDPVATVLAGYAAETLATHAAVVAHHTDVAQAATADALQRAVEAAAGSQDVFHDPFDDPDGSGPAALPPRVMLLGTTDTDPEAAALRLTGRTWPMADQLHLIEEIGPGVRQGPALRAAVLATRFDVAALYLGLAASGAAHLVPEPMSEPEPGSEPASGPAGS